MKFETVDGDDLPVFLYELASRFATEKDSTKSWACIHRAYKEDPRRGSRDRYAAPLAASTSASGAAPAGGSGGGGVNQAALNQAFNNQDVQSVIAQLLAGRMPGAPQGGLLLDPSEPV